MSRTLFILIAAAALAGCKTTDTGQVEPVIRTVTVQVPVAKACVPATLGEPDEYPDTDAALKAAASPAERYLLVVAGRALRIARLNELEPIVKACK